MKGEGGSQPAAGELPDDLVAALRAARTVTCAALAAEYRAVAALDDRARQAVAAEAAGAPDPVAAQIDEHHDDLVVAEVQTALGIGYVEATRTVEHARQVTHVVPRVLAALDAGVLDARRVRALLDGLDQVDEALAPEVVDTLLDKLAADRVTGPWDGPSPRTWRDRVTRAVVRADPDAARRRYQAAVAGRCVRSWPNGDGWGHLPLAGDGTFQACGPAEDIARIDDVLGQLAHQQPATGPDGSRVPLDHRRYQALVDLFDTVAAGQPLPSVPVRRERDLGLVVHADTFFDDGKHRDEPGEQRGLGAPVVLDPATARDLARQHLDARRRALVLLVGADGALDRLVRLPHPPAGGWTRHTLADQLRTQLPDLPPLRVDGYTPSVAIGEHVRAAWPTCAGYDCPRTARRCDLDHEDPWPRGPTDVANRTPKCRRDHQRKTLGLWKSQRQPDGSITWTTLLGTQVTTRPEPLPGC